MITKLYVLYNLKLMLMMRKIVLSLIAVLVGGMLSAFAQNKQVTGTVVNEQGDPMIGVTVQVKGTQYGTSSGVGGKFTVNAGSDDVLIFRISVTLR